MRSNRRSDFCLKIFTSGLAVVLLISMSRSLNSLIIVVFKFKILPVTDGLLKNFRATLPVLDVPLPFLTKDTLICNYILNKCWNFFLFSINSLLFFAGIFFPCFTAGSLQALLIYHTDRSILLSFNINLNKTLALLVLKLKSKLFFFRTFVVRSSFSLRFE